MSERKNIDRLFQEKFKDFEVNPSDEVWENIEAKLDEKKKRRVIPFWWKLSGVAALFLIGFLIFQSISYDGIAPKNAVVNEESSNKTEKTTSSDTTKKALENSGGIKTEKAIVNEANINKTEQKTTGAVNKNQSSITTDDAVVNTSNQIKSNTDSEEKNRKTKTIYPSNAAVAEKKSSYNRSLKNRSNTVKDKPSVTESYFEKSQNQLAQNPKNKTKEQNPNSQNNPSKATKNPSDSELTTQIVQTDSKEKSTKKIQTTTSDKKTINFDDLKGDGISKIATKEIQKKVNDTATAISSVATNVLEELLNEKESKSKQESKVNRWQLTSNVAPVFLGSISNGSPIDSTLSKNSKSYNTNVGFGLGVSYAVNKKLSIRTGLNKVNISYDTKNISFFEGIQAKTLQGVSPTASSEMIHVESSTASTNTAINPEDGLLPFETTFVHKSSGYLRQEMGYLEMPVEMTYNLLDKKFGIKVIGGFSTLFLQDNSIMIISSGGDTLLGEANNLNNVHFSTNLGLGVKYSFMKSFEFNIEPTVKYQLNTYSANDGNFKPYLFGIYSGISYKF